MNTLTEMPHQLKRKRDLEGGSSPAGPTRKRQNHQGDTLGDVTQDAVEQGLAYRSRENSDTVLPEETCENGINLADISSERLPAARVEGPIATREERPPKSPRKGPKVQKAPASISSPRKSRKAVADSQDDEDTIIVNGSKDPDFVPTTDIMSHFKTTKPKVKQKRQKPNHPIDPLFWQPFELTGDMIDDPDDDGEGLHGVGFELPPERAYAVRREKRQKIADWKAAVASEAREARSNRRSIFGPHSDSESIQGDIATASEIDTAKQKVTGKKAVRFAD